MKIRSQSELQDALDESLQRRKRELTALWFVIDQNRREHELQALRRAAVPIVYAHWEGFVTTAARAFLHYVARQSGALRTFAIHIIAGSVRAQLMTAGRAKRTSAHAQFIREFMSQMDRGIDLSPEDIISAEDNLNSDVLREIMVAIGIEFDAYWEKKAPFIDYKLLKTRNEIAHGELSAVDDSEYRQLHDFVVETLEAFKTAVENAAALSTFREPDVTQQAG